MHNQHPILIVGAGKIGVTVAVLLAHSGDYQVFLVDAKAPVELPEVQNYPIVFRDLIIQDRAAVGHFIQQHRIQGIVSCLPFHLTLAVAQIAEASGIHYFDPTEDVTITRQVKELAKTTQGVFAPQCGLAPGFISIAANSLIEAFGTVDQVRMRVGALSQNTNNFLHYNFTWSVEGVINEYIHPSLVLEQRRIKEVSALSGLETLLINGSRYEAFHTSGGAGSLVETYAGRVNNMDYKTIRYPGHCEKMRFILNDLQLRDNPTLAKEILERVVPFSTEDKVVVYVGVQGQKEGRLFEQDYAHEFYPAYVGQHRFTAIQMTTASSICVVIDLVMHEHKFKGLLRQEQIALSDFLANRFGHYYREKLATTA